MEWCKVLYRTLVYRIRTLKQYSYNFNNQTYYSTIARREIQRKVVIKERKINNNNAVVRCSNEQKAPMQKNKIFVNLNNYEEKPKKIKKG